MQNSGARRGEIVKLWLLRLDRAVATKGLLSLSRLRARKRERWSFAALTSSALHQFNTRLLSGLSSEKVGTSISNFSPLSLTI